MRKVGLMLAATLLLSLPASGAPAGSQLFLSLELAAQPGAAFRVEEVDKGEAERLLAGADAGIWLPDQRVVLIFLQRPAGAQPGSAGGRETTLNEFLREIEIESSWGSPFMAKAPAVGLLGDAPEAVPQKASETGTPRPFAGTVVFSDSFEFGLGLWINKNPGGAYQPTSTSCDARTGYFSLDFVRGGTEGQQLLCGSNYPGDQNQELAVPARDLVWQVKDGTVQAYFMGQTASQSDHAYMFARVNGMDSGYKVWGTYPSWTLFQGQVTHWPALGNLTANYNVEFGLAFFSSTQFGQGFGMRVDDYQISVTAPGTLNTLNVTKTGSGSGLVTSNPAGISCGYNCSGSYNATELVTLTATPDAGSRFAGWGGSCSGTGTCAVAMTQDRQVYAMFERESTNYKVLVSKGGSGTGLVLSSPAGITCGDTCTAYFAGGTQVQLTASPAAGSQFQGWTGACFGSATTCTLSITQDQRVNAIFVTGSNTLTVSKTGSGTGVVVSSPAGVTCGPTCSAPFASGQVVQLTASPDAGSRFAGWGGSCSGTGICTVTMSASRQVSATFEAVTPTFLLSATKSGTGTGLVSSSPAGISCGATCQAAFLSGQIVQLTATPDSGSRFTGWSGACGGSGTCTVLMNQAQTVAAVFDRNPTYTLSLTKSGGGTVSSAPSGISCGSTCSAAFAAGQVVQLTATPDAGWKLTGWSGACSGTGACSVTMSQNQGVGATFEPAGNPGELTLSQGRVVVTLTWRNPYNDQKGVGTAVKQMDQYGYFWFDDANNPEVFVKVLDTGDPAYQVYHSSLGTFEYTVNFKVVRTGITYPFNRPAYSVCGAADATTVKK